ncbi:hypothetical protein JCM5296_006839 [Sporobolomyces johnsonii]
MPPRSGSRIPRSTAHLPSTATTNENTPPLLKPSSLPQRTAAKSRIPAASSTAAALSATTSNANTDAPASSARGNDPRLSPDPAGENSIVEISIQLPTSPPLELDEHAGAFADEDERALAAGERQEQIPTPPSSQSPPRKGKGKALAAGGEVEASSNSLLPVPFASTSRLAHSRRRSASAQPTNLAPSSKPKPRRSVSRSPSINALALPAGPLHSAHVIAARRRSSISPLPPPSSQPQPRSRTRVSPNPSSKPSSTPSNPSNPTTKKRTKSKLRPRPSETLPEAIELSSDGDDPLLLLPPEQHRGKGEGKSGMSRALIRGKGKGSMAQEAMWTKEGRGRSAGVGVGMEVKDEGEAVEQEQAQSLAGDEGEREQEEGEGEGETMQQGEEHPEYEIYQPEENAEDQDLGGFDGHFDVAYPEDLPLPVDDDEPRPAPTPFALPQEDDEAIAVNFGSDTEDHAQEEEDEGGFLPLQEASSDFSADSDSDSEGDASSSRQFRTRPSFPPLSPNQTGEFDDEIPIHPVSESPAPWEDEEETPDLREKERPSPFLRSTESVEADQDAKPSLAIEDEVKAEEVAPVLPPVASASTFLSPVASTFLSPVASTSNPASAFLSTSNRVGSPVVPSLPTLNFAQLRSPRERFTSFPSPSSSFARRRAVTPSSTSAAQPIPSPALSQGWTRGPAFFRSSSFSPPPVVSSFARKPKLGQGEDQEEGERSREYWRFGSLTATSPHASVREGTVEEEESEEEGVVLVGEQHALERERSRSESVEPVAPAQSADVAQPVEPNPNEEPQPPPTPAKDRPSPRPQEQDAPGASDDDDASMSSPVSLRSRHSSASPPRSPGGDILMSSPAASVRSLPLSVRSPASEHKKLPATPPPGAVAEEDARMGSPSPLRTAAEALVSGVVEQGRAKLQGLLFGPRPTASTPTTTVVPQPRPAPEQSTSYPRPPASAADSTFSSSFSFSTTASRSTSGRRRPRPSHPSLPVIEISSTDARAAARAAAILKVYHKYVEQGISSEGKGKGKEVVRHADRQEEDEEDGDDDEEELRTLLLDAEDEVRETIPRARSVSFVDEADGASSARHVAEEQTPSPTTSQRAEAPSISSTQGRSRTVSVESTSARSSVVGERWTSREWRGLEQTLVELTKRKRKEGGGEVEGEEVIEVFLEKWDVQREECRGDWEWNKLLIRVEAIRSRRAKDARLKRASSQSSVVSTATSRYSTAPALVPRSLGDELRNVSTSSHTAAPVEEDREDTPRAEADRTVSPNIVVKSEDGSDAEDELHQRQHDAPNESESEDDEDHSLEDDTFFATSRRNRRARRSSMPHTHLPSALSNPRLAHLYDDTPPEKPRLPTKDWLERESSNEPGERPVEEEEEEEEERERTSLATTPELQTGERSQPASTSTQRLFSYLGSFVRRSPAPSPSSTLFAPASSVTPSASPEPEPQSETAPEMSEAKLHAALVIPQFIATTSQPFPTDDESLPHRQQLRQDRRILPLPPSHFAHSAPDPRALSTPAASTSRLPPLDLAPEPETARRGRRRSSGEGQGRVWQVVHAIEEAESSREEEEARIIELLQSGSAKRRAAAGDLRRKEAKGTGKGKGKGKERERENESEWRGFVEIEVERGMVPAGTRALDRRPRGEGRSSRK